MVYWILPKETGAALASRALAWGTFYAVGGERCPITPQGQRKVKQLSPLAGCGILFFSIWKMMGVQNMTEFRQKVLSYSIQIGNIQYMTKR